ncbi:MAG: FAD-binding oxidoreductase [Chloroflexi bacterium]|nr:FAD-binding oxidoreductase [Chloroflexota bacterium]
MRVVVCGGGVIGTLSAYFLSRRGAAVMLVERAGVANASSGKAGAFLALDWSSGSALDALARRSFALHAQLAEELDDDWGYQRVTTYGAYAAPDRGGRRGPAPSRNWLSDEVTIAGQLGSTETTAVVHPRRFTEAILRAALAHGAELRMGQVTGMLYSDDGTAVQGVQVDDDSLEADAVVIAMGPWSLVASGWLPLPAIVAYKGQSLLFETGASVPPEAVFFEYQDPSGVVLTPELFPRADGTTYVAFSSVQDRMPFDPADVHTDAAAIEQLAAVCERLSPALTRSNIIARQACYRPVTQDGLPLIGKVPGIAGAYVATGHSVWGVLNAPATGEALAELILDGAARSVDLRPFDPGRLRPLAPR